jgi:arginine decarboxylase
VDQRETPLADAAQAFLAAEVTPFTTPGHKRSPQLADDFLLHDLPLSSGADDLHMRSDVLGRAERLAADLWGAALCRFCANGSTQGNQALALALGRPGERVVIARSMHKSVLAGLVLSGLEPVWVRPDIDPKTGLPRALPPERVGAALAATPDACGVFLVEPSFVGIRSDIAAIAASVHTAGVPLVVDQAWGAHFGFHPEIPPHALEAGADGFVASAHKTLAAFTQSAYLLARGGFLDLERLDGAFELLHTTSPSGALLASLDRARMIMATRGQDLLGETLRLAEYARARLCEVEGLVVVESDDPTKLALALPGTGADGLEVEADLFAQGIRFELANRDLLVPLLTIADTEVGVERLCDALIASVARRRGEPRVPGAASAVWDVTPETAMTPREAFFSAREVVAAEEAAGRVAAEMVAPYPPGIPAIAPGEIISRELVDALREAAEGGTRLAYCVDPTLATLQVLAPGSAD